MTKVYCRSVRSKRLKEVFRSIQKFVGKRLKKKKGGSVWECVGVKVNLKYIHA